MNAQVTVDATLRWLHEEGLARLAGAGGSAAEALCAYTIEVATGTVTGYPMAGDGHGGEVMSLPADDLPAPLETAKRLVVVGVTTAGAVLVVDLATVHAMAVEAERPHESVRAWVLQLLLNPEVTVTTNSADVVVVDAPRCRHSFIPGGGATIVHVDDKRLPVTAITLDAGEDGPNHLDVAADGSGELYLGPRYWRLAQVLLVDDRMWGGLAATLEQHA
ncbi:hypothetical protein [Nocardia brasiliensis]|uniref:hypothetical protein n=1 Tax=Nocardia brasiliensis TaxID=37326 RepID=UPI002454C6F8|nr:hypothetical protein [Nocardia brasiliensis]